VLLALHDTPASQNIRERNDKISEQFFLLRFKKCVQVVAPRKTNSSSFSVSRANAKYQQQIMDLRQTIFAASS
jgi:hypothetical protein